MLTDARQNVHSVLLAFLEASREIVFKTSTSNLLWPYTDASDVLCDALPVFFGHVFRVPEPRDKLLLPALVFWTPFPAHGVN
jgi:hypothetical protein